MPCALLFKLPTSWLTLSSLDTRQVWYGMRRAGCVGRAVRMTWAGPDPLVHASRGHPQLAEVEVARLLAHQSRAMGSPWAHLRYCAPLCIGLLPTAGARVGILQELGPRLTLQDVLNK